MDVSQRSLYHILYPKDNSKAKGGITVFFKDKLYLIQSSGVEVHHPNLIWEYSPQLDNCFSTQPVVVITSLSSYQRLATVNLILYGMGEHGS